MSYAENVIVKSKERSAESLAELLKIEQHDTELESYFNEKTVVEQALSRSMVSFQANKTRSEYRWFKYKEAFSASLVEYLLGSYGINSGCLLDPFAGAGTALFAANELGLMADGIELLPIGREIIQTRQIIREGISEDELALLESWIEKSNWKHEDNSSTLNELRITRGAFSIQTQAAIENYLAAANRQDGRIRTILRFALLCVLESVSYTRKDGQYLRWDYRSGRRLGGKPFDKGFIPDFDTAIRAKLLEIVHDLKYSTLSLDLFSSRCESKELNLYAGSCLDVLPTLDPNHYDIVLTSPPYCNRYDYTRTYALELAMLDASETDLVQMRQAMLSCTVENRVKNLLEMNNAWQNAIAIAEQQSLLQSVLQYLDHEKMRGSLNNDGIPRMVRGYFYEMACIVFECYRVLKPNSLMFMVNDNVRYAGASISVDYILSSIAERIGFSVERIMVLPGGKGNSSQQMGEHGRALLRKCVYVWRKSE